MLRVENIAAQYEAVHDSRMEDLAERYEEICAKIKELSAGIRSLCQ